MNVFKKAIRNLAKRSGFELLRSSSSRIPGPDPLFDIARILNRSDPTIFDVGANVGQTAKSLRRIFSSPRIHCFEPSPTTFSLLAQSIGAAPNISINNIGLGDQPGTLELNENDYSDMSSFLQFGDVWGSVKNRVHVPISTVDAYCAERNISQIDLLKTDTQGYDFHVLRGGDRKISSGQVRFILTEIVLDDMYVGVERFDKILGHLFDRSFSLFGFYNQHWRRDKLSWADAVFVRT